MTGHTWCVLQEGRSAATTVLPPETTSARKAREFVGQILQRWSLSRELGETAALLTSELVSNAVLHARTDLVVSMASGVDGTMHIAVVDGSPSYPVRQDADHEALAGRGLMLIEALAVDWGVQATCQGKVVWFELDHDAPDPAGAVSTPA